MTLNVGSRVVVGVMFLDESVETISLLGTVLVLAGAYLTSRREGHQ
jgi:drug/metabolite transporter (DMT)-like permease